MLTRALGVAILPLLAAQNCDIVLPPPPTREEACLSYATWGVLGLAPEQVPELPDQLLKARMRIGETASLHASPLGQQADCDDLVSAVAWRSSVSGVADITPGSLLEGRLEARSPGETALWADVTLQNGAVRRAELHAVPAGRTARLRVYAVVVTR